MNSRVAASCSLRSRRIFLALSMLVPVHRMDVLPLQYSTAARGLQPPQGDAEESVQRPPKSLAHGASPLTLEHVAAAGAVLVDAGHTQHHYSSLAQIPEQERVHTAHV